MVEVQFFTYMSQILNELKNWYCNMTCDVLEVNDILSKYCCGASNHKCRKGIFLDMMDENNWVAKKKKVERTCCVQLCQQIWTTKWRFPEGIEVYYMKAIKLEKFKFLWSLWELYFYYFFLKTFQCVSLQSYLRMHVKAFYVPDMLSAFILGKGTLFRHNQIKMWWRLS